MPEKILVKTDVYSRVVGYYSPTSNWNIGKKQEYKERNKYDSVLTKCTSQVDVCSA